MKTVNKKKVLLGVLMFVFVVVVQTSDSTYMVNDGSSSGVVVVT